MRKHRKILVLAVVAILFCYMGSLLLQKEQLSDALIRMHVVAASDSDAEQALKLKVRDAVLKEVVALGEWEKTEEALCALSAHLDQIEAAANQILKEEGSSHRAEVTLCTEEFPIRKYDTFTLPSGVYQSLRVTIGPGEGANWWCVVFPKLCMPAVGEDVSSVAVDAGFSDSLIGTISGEKEYQVRFFLLDCLGKLENFFHFR